jgi:hypothetical protein
VLGIEVALVHAQWASSFRINGVKASGFGISQFGRQPFKEVSLYFSAMDCHDRNIEHGRYSVIE